MKNLEIQKSIFTTVKGKNTYNFKDLIRENLVTLNVPFNDVCCPNLSTNMSPIRRDSETGNLEYFNGTDWTALSVGGAEPMDVFLIAGQSNAVGQGNSAQSPNPEAETVYQYYSNALTEVTNEVGNANSGSAWPSFGITYSNATGRKICFVPTAVSGAGMSEAANTASGALASNNWGTTGTLYQASVDVLQAALVAVADAGYTPVFRGILWIQGETDALAINASAINISQYKTPFQTMLANYRTEFGADTPLYMVKIGTRSATDDTGFAAVRNAQEEVVAEDPVRNIMVYRNTYDFIARGLMFDAIHWNQTALNEIGRVAANVVTSPTNEINNTLFTRKLVGGVGTTSSLHLQSTTGGAGSQNISMYQGANGSIRSMYIPYSTSGAQVWDMYFGGNRGLVTVRSGISAGYTGFRFDRDAAGVFMLLLDETGTNTGLFDSGPRDFLISHTLANSKIKLGGRDSAIGVSVTNILIDNETRSVAIASSSQAAASSSFDVYSPNNNKGSRPYPLMTEAQRLAIASPAIGLHVYQTDGTEGVYVNKSSGWAFAY